MSAIERRRLIGLGLAAALVAGTGSAWSESVAQADDEGSGILAGHVTGDDGTPLAHVTVTVTSAMLDAGDASLTTDDAGRFSLAPAPVGLYDVAAERNGYRPGAVGALRVASGGATQVEIVLERRGPGESSYYRDSVHWAARSSIADGAACASLGPSL